MRFLLLSSQLLPLDLQFLGLLRHSSYVERLEVFRDEFDRLGDESLSICDKLIAFCLVKSHIEPFESETLVWHRAVSCRE